MTRADGDIYLDVHASADNLSKEVEIAGKEAAKDNEDNYERDGRNLARAMARGFGDQLRREGEALADDVRDLADDIRDHMDDIEFDLDRRGSAVRSGRRAGAAAGRGFLDAFENSGVGSALTGPVGAFFNISGKSPLALVLIPILGAIVALITAAVYWLQALSSLLFLVPSLLAAIGIQAGALFMIFGGVGETIAAAFAAKTPEEFMEALKGVNAEVAQFVRQLIPWRDMWNELKGVAQTNFFGQIGDTQMMEVLNNLRGVFTAMATIVSSGLGEAFSDLLTSLSDPVIANALAVLAVSINQWLTGGGEGEGFGEALGGLITGLFAFMQAIDPFLDWFGTQFNSLLIFLGEKLETLGSDPEFLSWLEDAKVVMREGIGLLGALWDAVKLFFENFSEADKEFTDQNGFSFLEGLTAIVMALIEIFDSEFGRAAMRGFIDLLLVLTWAAGGVAVAIGFFLYVYDGLILALQLGYEVLRRFMRELRRAPLGVETAKQAFLSAFETMKNFVVTALTFMGDKVTEKINLIVTTITGIKARIISFFRGALEWLVQAGKNVIQGFINGLTNNALVRTFENVITYMRNKVQNPFNNDPAPWNMGTGGAVVRNSTGGGSGINKTANSVGTDIFGFGGGAGGRFVQGNTFNTSGLSSVAFGPGSVQIIFKSDTPPDQQQAKMLGKSAAKGIVDQMRNTRIASRTLSPTRGNLQ